MEISIAVMICWALKIRRLKKMAAGENLQVRLDNEMLDDILRESKALRISKSALVRNILKAHFTQSSVLVDTMLLEQARQANEMATIKEAVLGIAALTPMVFGMVKVATYSEEHKDKMKAAADQGRAIMKKTN
jgi:hypothetical protein